mmetsp:Transcript_11403/g.41728  ORF Transcript_11403/g.41728 Transcript_11403/m.41728 type:complete len:202 (-) Transcript_11403:1545-2150(-)
MRSGRKINRGCLNLNGCMLRLDSAHANDTDCTHAGSSAALRFFPWHAESYILFSRGTRCWKTRTLQVPRRLCQETSSTVQRKQLFTSYLGRNGLRRSPKCLRAPVLQELYLPLQSLALSWTKANLLKQSGHRFPPHNLFLIPHTQWAVRSRRSRPKGLLIRRRTLRFHFSFLHSCSSRCVLADKLLQRVLQELLLQESCEA